MGAADRVGAFVHDHPKVVAAAFGVLLASSVPVLTGVDVYLSIYELSPRAEYYDHFRVLNRDLGWDNLGAVLMTLPAGHEERNVTDPRKIRAMNHLELELERLEFVEGALSLAELVRIMNSRADYAVSQYVEGGIPRVDLLPAAAPQPKDKASGFPEEGAEGDARIEASMAIALDLLGDQIYGNILAPDNKSALMVVVMRTGATGEEYRVWQETLLAEGIRVGKDPRNPYRSELELRPLSIDIIYSTLDDVATTEGPSWIAAAAAAGLATVAYLFRRPSAVFASLAVLVVVVTVTLAAATWRGVDFNLLSLLVAALIFAAGIDYTMHVTSRYREERDLGYDPRRAAVKALRALGPALLITSVTTTAGFMSLYFSRIPAIGDFGLMVGAAIFAAFLACLTLLPALLAWVDKATGADGTHGASEAEAERLREERTKVVRARQKRSPMGRLGGALARRPVLATAFSVVALVALASPLTTKGVEVWGASYLEPHAIFEEETYSVQALRLMDETFGIPNEVAVVFYGDATDPAVVRYLDRLQQETQGVHARTKTDSVPNALRLYTSIVNPDPRIDQDRDGLPDTQEQIKAAYDAMRKDPATSVLLSRVVHHEPGRLNDYPLAAHRLGVNPQPADSLGTDVDNYRQSRADVEEGLRVLADEERRAGLSHGTTGLAVLGVEVVDAIIRGNTASVLVMLAVVYLLLSLFWRAPDLALIAMLPIGGAVIAQYSLTALLGYEVTYVSLILTGMVMGIGVDDAVHYIQRFKEEVRRRNPVDAASLASAEIGTVLVGTTITTMSPFFVILGSVVTWARQTAFLVLPTLAAALAVTLLTLPGILAWHARVRPGAYR